MTSKNAETREPQDLLNWVLDRAKGHGATSADALFVTSRSSEVRVRLGEMEQTKQSQRPNTTTQLNKP